MKTNFNIEMQTTGDCTNGTNISNLLNFSGVN